MLTPLEIYNKFQLKVNKNDTNTNIKVPKGQFVVLFNEQKRKWLDKRNKTDEDSNYIEDLEYLLEVDVPLVKISSSSIKDEFATPANFFKRVGSYSVASRGECKNVILTNWFIKPKDFNVLLNNNNQNPDFDYRETLALINNDKLSIYKSGFDIDEVYLTYYREPKDLDIEGYIKVDGTVSTNVQIDLNDRLIEEILDYTVTEVLRNYESVEQLQIALQRQQK